MPAIYTFAKGGFMYGVRNYLCVLVICILACAKHVEGDAEEALLFSKMPRREISKLKNIRLSVVAEHWAFADSSATALRDLDEEIRARVGAPSFWKKPAEPNSKDEPEMVVILSASRIGQERTILFYHAFLVETVSLPYSNEKLRAVTWYGQPWYGSAYPAALMRVVKQGRDFVIADMERNARP